jgi:SWI/SNF-related matrix-associated actin-dependent regulator 1 of chromatin subfamily A
MSYDLATRRADELIKHGFKSVIADEAHYLKSRDAKRSLKLIPIFSNAKRCILISGTPMLSRPAELFNLVRILRPDIFSNFSDFS